MKTFTNLLRSLRTSNKSERLRRSEAQNILMAQDLTKLHANYLALLRMNKEGQLAISSIAVTKHLTILLQLRDYSAYQHGVRVARLSAHLGRLLDLDSAYCTMIELAAPLHDIGILALPDGIFLAEHAAGRRFDEHTMLGERILDSDDHILSIAAQIARSHHEHYDGSGYPDGLIGDNIALVARIVSVADRFDDLLHGLHGNPQLSAAEAFNDIFGQYGTRFDPQVVRALNLGMDEYLHEIDSLVEGRGGKVQSTGLATE